MVRLMVDKSNMQFISEFRGPRNQLADSSHFQCVLDRILGSSTQQHLVVKINGLIWNLSALSKNVIFFFLFWWVKYGSWKRSNTFCPEIKYFKPMKKLSSIFKAKIYVINSTWIEDTNAILSDSQAIILALKPLWNYDENIMVMPEGIFDNTHTDNYLKSIHSCRW